MHSVYVVLDGVEQGGDFLRFIDDERGVEFGQEILGRDLGIFQRVLIVECDVVGQFEEIVEERRFAALPQPEDTGGRPEAGAFADLREKVPVSQACHLSAVYMSCVLMSCIYGTMVRFVLCWPQMRLKKM